MNGSASRKFPDPAILDFGCASGGEGRRLEHLAGIVVDRPMPATQADRRQEELWKAATVVFHETSRGQGRWNIHGHLPDPWQIKVPLSGGTICLAVRPAPSGQLGVFLEQQSLWQWLTQVTPSGSRVLSLFAHSGAASLALAQAGAEVVHVDSSRQAMDLARTNATASGLGTKPIRWICEDAKRFVTRELRRGNRYDGIVLDPPSWGHGPKGEAFSIDRDLPSLLGNCGQLLYDDITGPVLLSAHSPGWPPHRLQEILRRSLAIHSPTTVPLESGALTCRDLAGRHLPLGGFARAISRPKTTQPKPAVQQKATP